MDKDLVRLLNQLLAQGQIKTSEERELINRIVHELLKENKW